MRYNTVTRHGRQCPRCLEIRNNEDFSSSPGRLGIRSGLLVCIECGDEIKWFEKFPHGTDCVYLIESGRCWKIGYTANLIKRIPALRNMSPVAVKLVHVWVGGKDLESATHRRLRRYRHHGEWFELSPQILQDIREGRFKPRF